MYSLCGALPARRSGVPGEAPDSPAVSQFSRRPDGLSSRRITWPSSSSTWPRSYRSWRRQPQLGDVRLSVAPKRSPHRFEIRSRRPTAYETQGVELMQQRLRQRGSAGGAPATAARIARCASAVPGASLTASSSGGRRGHVPASRRASGRMRTNGDMASQLQQTLQEQPASSAISSHLFRLPGSDRLQQTPRLTSTYLAEVDKLLSEGNPHVRGRSRAGQRGAEILADEALIASLQANLLADVGRKRDWQRRGRQSCWQASAGDEEEEKDEG
uniref:Uncharacterized protein n=1 Tax=Macrostomum lignano TaxID=282301 RepID=A0A1I8FQ08_9PLAT